MRARRVANCAVMPFLISGLTKSFMCDCRDEPHDRSSRTKLDGTDFLSCSEARMGELEGSRYYAQTTKCLLSGVKQTWPAGIVKGYLFICRPLICASAAAATCLIFFAAIGALGATKDMATSQTSLITPKINTGIAMMMMAPTTIKAMKIRFFILLPLYAYKTSTACGCFRAHERTATMSASGCLALAQPAACGR